MESCRFVKRNFCPKSTVISCLALFLTKYLESINHDDYQKWFDKGFDLADRYHYRFLKHRFLNLKTSANEAYDETKYPFPDDLDVEAYIEKYNKYWSDKEKESPKK